MNHQFPPVLTGTVHAQSFIAPSKQQQQPPSRCSHAGSHRHHGRVDFGSATLRRNLVSHVARQVVRLAIVRGADAGPELPVWGPATQTFQISDNHPIANTLRPIAGGSATSSFQVQLEWIDGGNAAEQRVRATVTGRFSSLLGVVAGSKNVPLQARSTMPIVH
jgi:hypothetical protein